MNTMLSRRLNDILKQYVPASPELSESVIEWFNDWQRDTSAVDHADLKAEIQDLKLDIKDLRIELKDEIHALELNTSERFSALEKNTAERFSALEKNTVLMRSELKEQIHSLEKNTSEQIHSLEKNFLAFQKSIKVTLAWAMLLITGLLFPIALPHIQSWFQR